MNQVEIDLIIRLYSDAQAQVNTQNKTITYLATYRDALLRAIEESRDQFTIMNRADEILREWLPEGGP